LGASTTLRILGRYDEAEQCLRGALEGDPQRDANLNAHVGWIELARNRVTESLRIFNEVIAATEDYTVAWEGKLVALRILKDYEGALKFADEALPKTDMWLGIQKGEIYFEQNDLERALDCFTATSKAQPGHLDSHFRRADVLCLLNRSSEAQSLL